MWPVKEYGWIFSFEPFCLRPQLLITLLHAFAYVRGVKIAAETLWYYAHLELLAQSYGAKVDKKRVAITEAKHGRCDVGLLTFKSIPKAREKAVADLKLLRLLQRERYAGKGVSVTELLKHPEVKGAFKSEEGLLLPLKELMELEAAGKMSVSLPFGATN